jgi:TRAP transporter TAXI family solute receptor
MNERMVRSRPAGPRSPAWGIRGAWKPGIAAIAVAATVLAAPAALRAAEFINVLTGGTSGVYYPLGVALSKIWGEAVPDARTQVQATKASVENLNLLQQGRGEAAITLGDSLKLAWEGDEEAGFAKPLNKLRGITALYPNYIHFVVRSDSGISSLADLKGKRISVGAPKSGTEINSRTILNAAGLSYDDLGKVEYLPYAESVELMKNRQLDGTLLSSGLGVAAIRDLATSIDVDFVPIPADLVEQIGAPYVSIPITAGTYRGQDEDVPTAGVVNFLVTHDDVSEETVYLMTKSMFENLDEMVAAHGAAKAIELDKATGGMPVPLHPGAERYYTEEGVL